MIPLKCQKYCIYTRKRHSQKEALKTVYHVDLVQINVCKVPLYTSFSHSSFCILNVSCYMDSKHKGF